VNRDVLEPVKRCVLSALHDVTALRDYPETFTEPKRKEIADHAASRLEAAFKALGFTDQDLWNEMSSLQGSGVLEDWTGPRHRSGHK
jgi:hypothetical protein